MAQDLASAEKGVRSFGLTVAKTNAQSVGFSTNGLSLIVKSLDQVRLEAQIASNSFVQGVQQELENLQLKSDVLGLDSASEQFDLLGQKINVVKTALQDAAVEFGINSEAVTVLKEQLTPLQEQYATIEAAQRSMQEVTAAANSAFEAGAAAAKDSSEEQQNAFQAAGAAALAASAKVIKAELSKAVATQIAKLLASVPPPFNLILAAGAGAAVGALFQRALGALNIPGLAKGGIIPEGFPNDSFPAMLSSGEAVIPLDRINNILDSGRDVGVTGQFILRGNDLVAAVERGNFNKNRIV